MERDPWRKSGDLKQKISTHTLTWSVTGGEIQLRDQDGNFNSHAHVERDSLSVVRVAINCISTHTLTWSVTISAPATAGGIDNFNSHAHVERDCFSATFIPL